MLNHGRGMPCRELAKMPLSVKIMPNLLATHGPRVVAIAYDGLCTSEFGIACEVFGLPRPELGAAWYRYQVAAIEPGPLRASGGSPSSPRMAATRSTRPTYHRAGRRAIDAPVPRTDALRAAQRAGPPPVARSGIAVLAATGLLDGRRATTHWRYVDAIASAYPQIRLEPSVLYVDEGDMMTAAGSAAGIDLCLHLVRKDFGAEFANAVARRLVVPPHRDGGQAQFVPRPVPVRREGGRLGALIDELRARPGVACTIRALAGRVGMSPRTFQRRFEEATGLAPGEWLIAERVRLAQELLEVDPAAGLDDVAAACGFGSSEGMRHHFRRRVGLSPGAFRRRFAGSMGQRAASSRPTAENRP